MKQRFGSFHERNRPDRWLAEGGMSMPYSTEIETGIEPVIRRWKHMGKKKKGEKS